MKVPRFVVAGLMFCLVLSTASRVSADEYATRDEAMALVKQAIARVAEVGMDKAKPEFMDHGGRFIDRDLYLIIIDKAGVVRWKVVNPIPQARDISEYQKALAELD